VKVEEFVKEIMKMYKEAKIALKNHRKNIQIGIESSRV